MSRLLLLVCSILLAPQALLSQGQGELQRLSLEDLREDLRFFAEQLPQRHANLFHQMTEQEFNQAVIRLERRLPRLTQAEFAAELARILARVGDGHTRLAPRDPLKELGWRRYPLELFLFSDGLAVQAAHPEYREAVGACVVKIGNAPAQEAVTRARALASGDNEMSRRRWLVLPLLVPEILQALGLVEDGETATFVLDKDGRKTTHALTPRNTWSQQGWVDARDIAQQPLPRWLKNPGDWYWFEYLEEAKTVYVQFNVIRDKEEESIEEFFRRVFAFVDAQPVERLVLDIRLNGGGNKFLAWPVVYELIRRPELNQRGKVYTLIGRHTFSAAASLAVFLEQHTETLFAGEPTGGKPNVYSESESFRLPRSGIRIQYSSAYWQNSTPFDERPWVPPNIAVELSSEDYRRNHDPVLSAVLKHEPQPRLPDSMTEIIIEQGLEAGLEHYRAFKVNPQNQYADTAWALHLVGRRLLFRDHGDEALPIFLLNLQENPRYDRGYEDLAEYYEKAGNKEAAIEALQKALEVNPENWDAWDRLRALRGEATH